VLPTFTALLPQTVLLVAACLLFLGGSSPARRKVWGTLSILALLVSGICLMLMPQLMERVVGGLPTESVGPANLIVTDSLSWLFQWVFLAAGLLFTLMALSEQSDSASAAEFYGLLLTLIAGLMLVASANELILLFLGLELVSIPTYVLLYLGRRDNAAKEAAVKYFLLSVLSAAILLYGFSFLYGLTGTTNLTGIRMVLSASYVEPAAIMAQATGSRLGILALVLIFSGLGFKIAAVPFHFYAPDVYQGTTAWNAGLLAFAPKAAGFLALIRVASYAMPGFENSGETIALILAMFTMTVGNILALLQTNIRRLLAYSSIAHAGYMLIGIAVGFWESWNPGQRLDPLFGLPGGIQSCLFYLIVYSLVTVGIFAVLVYLQRPNAQIEHIDDLTGLWRTQPLVAISAALFLFSLMGIPPLPGFWGKLTIFAGALTPRADVTALPIPKTWFLVLAVVGVLNAAIAAVYYLRIVGIMFLHDPLGSREPSGGRPAYATIIVTATLTLGIGIQARPILNYLRNVNAPGQMEVVKEKPAEATSVAASRN